MNRTRSNVTRQAVVRWRLGGRHGPGAVMSKFGKALKSRRSGLLAVALFGLAAAWWLANQRTTEEIAPDEEVILFPTAARLSGDGTAWLVPVHGWVFEPESHSALRETTIAALGDVVGAEALYSDVLKERLAPFLVDNQRGQKIRVQLGDITKLLEPSGADGHFRGELQLPVAAAKTLARNRWLTVHVTVGERSFEGPSYLIGPSGVSVISDIDDTVKVSAVTDKTELLRNTFLRPMKVADGMAELYQRWATKGVAFHFVSSSPWQLWPLLDPFLRNAGFPRASYALKDFRLKDGSFFELLDDPLDTKAPAIEQILAAYPARRFCLVGDSGDEDPEVYGTIARAHPDRIERIYIRNVTREAADDARFVTAFERVDNWHLFVDPEQLPPCSATVDEAYEEEIAVEELSSQDDLPIPELPDDERGDDEPTDDELPPCGQFDDELEPNPAEKALAEEDGPDDVFYGP